MINLLRVAGRTAKLSYKEYRTFTRARSPFLLDGLGNTARIYLTYKFQLRDKATMPTTH